MSKKWLLAGVLVGGPIAGAVVVSVSSSTQKTPLFWSLVITGVFIAAIIALLQLAATSTNTERQKFGYLQVLLGSDGRVSTSKTAVATWTLVFAASLMFLSVMVWFGNLDADAAFGNDWDPYFLLLGGPFASAVLAKGITSGKVSSGEITKTPTVAATQEVKTSTVVENPAQPAPANVLTDDGGEISLPDTQYVVFTFVAIAYFIGAFVALLVDYAQGDSSEITLPPIPSALLGLTSLAALTYVGSKALEKEGVRVVTVTPPTPLAHTTLTVTLVNVRAGASIDNVQFIWTTADGPAESRGASTLAINGSITTVECQCPAAGDYGVVIVTPNGSTAPFKVAVT